MSTSSATPYSVVITLQPPEAHERLTLALTLYPSDSVPVTDGVAKPVRDCTLAELQGYADALEAELGALLADITVGTLVATGELPLAIDAPAADWLDRVVLLDPPLRPEDVAPTPPAAPLTADATAAPADAGPPDAPPATPAGDDGALAAAITPGAIAAPAVSAPTPTLQTATPPVPEPPLPSVPVPAVGTPPAQPAPRTAGHLARADYPRNTATVILLDEAPLRQMQEHAASSLRREVAGFMLGPLPEKQPGGQYIVHVTDMLIAEHTRMSGASVTYTPESWRTMHDRRLARYPADDVVVVGWYHTHPGFGIFLSNMDLFIHQNFFTQKWHIAYVLDPVALRSGFFSWDRAQSQVVAYPFAWPQWAANSW